MVNSIRILGFDKKKKGGGGGGGGLFMVGN